MQGKYYATVPEMVEYRPIIWETEGQYIQRIIIIDID